MFSELIEVDSDLERLRKRALGFSVKATSEKKFSTEEVRAMIRQAVEDRERELVEEFQKVLTDRLAGLLLHFLFSHCAEQYQAFVRFNEDNIARQMRERSCTRSAGLTPQHLLVYDLSED